jgi:hypothetical protein
MRDVAGASSIREVSGAFFAEVVLPILEREFPEETARGAFGLFGYGSEAYGLDDDLSRDHHWGVRIDGLVPDDVTPERRIEIQERVRARLPDSFRGHSLREGHLAGAGLTLDGLGAFLTRTIGFDHPPQSDTEWLQIPEEEILHVTNGEVWHDPSGGFTRLRAFFAGYYPEPVRRRRIAHWCRYFSGMGAYALKRAILRDNDFYAATAFGKALRWGVQLAFLLDRAYFPYDKWLMAYLERLPRLGVPMRPLVTEAARPDTSWERKLALLDRMADLLDFNLVGDGLIRPHPRFHGSPTSGYRLLEHAYAELIQGLSPELRAVIPVWDQVHLERFHVGYVAGLGLEEWDQILGLKEGVE